jgi:hypothetical protein
VPWSIEGHYFENCSCNVVCPCTASLDLGADRDYCRAMLVFHVDRGEVEGVDVSDLSVAAVIDTPKVMAEGNWRLGMIIDERASDDQAEALGGVFSGAMGGPMAGLGPLVGEQLGVERLSIDIDDDGGRHAVTIGDGAVDVEVQEVVSFGREDGKAAQLNNVFHPAGETLTIAKATRSHIDVLGVQFSSEGGSGFAAPFAWSA